MFRQKKISAERSKKHCEVTMGDAKATAKIDDDTINGADVKEKQEPSSSSNLSMKSNSSSDNNNNNSSDCDTRTVYIGCMPPRLATSRLHVEKLMMRFGDIVRISMTDRGFAFCEFTKQEHAAAAIAGLDGRPLLGKRLAVKPARYKDEKPSPSQRAVSAASTRTPKNEEKRIDSRIEEIKKRLAEKRSKASKESK